MASPAIINGIPGPGKTRKIIPNRTSDDPTLATNIHLKGWGSRLHKLFIRINSSESNVFNYMPPLHEGSVAEIRGIQNSLK
jgi:hypothetical protein